VTASNLPGERTVLVHRLESQAQRDGSRARCLSSHPEVDLDAPISKTTKGGGGVLIQVRGLAKQTPPFRLAKSTHKTFCAIQELSERPDCAERLICLLSVSGKKALVAAISGPDRL
jgi:hypothetical protein